jgi:hypothetical protein
MTKSDAADEFLGCITSCSFSASGVNNNSTVLTVTTTATTHLNPVNRTSSPALRRGAAYLLLHAVSLGGAPPLVL